MKIIEVFESLQGEGPKIGKPSIFLRLCGCNMKCKFNCLTEEDSRGLEESWSAQIKKVNNGLKLNDLLLLDKGCDSYPAILPGIYNKLAKDYTIEELAVKIVSSKAQCVILTGGEPLLHFEEIFELKKKVEDIVLNDLIYCLMKRKEWCFETNGTIDISDMLGHGFFFVISPKLDYMSEEQKEIFSKNLELISNLVFPEKYVCLKLVVQDEDELKILIEEKKWIMENKNLIYIMPQGSELNTDFLDRSRVIADECVKLGLNFTPRLQNYLWKNEWGK